MNIFEGVDTSVLDNMAWTVGKMLGIFILAPGILGIIIGLIIRASQKTMKFIIVLFLLIGVFIWLSNYDWIYAWLS